MKKYRIIESVKKLLERKTYSGVGKVYTQGMKEVMHELGANENKTQEIKVELPKYLYI
jgi:hypothetical protein